MVSCERTESLLARIADGALPDADRDALERHLATCPDCRAALDGQRLVATVLRGRPAASPPPGLAARVADAIDRETDWLGVVNWRGWSVRLAPVAGGLLLAALLAGRTASTQPAPDLSALADAWAVGSADASLPATALFWQSDVSIDSLLVALLTTNADDPPPPSATDTREGVR